MMLLCLHFVLNLSLMYWDPKSAIIVAGRRHSARMLVTHGVTGHVVKESYHRES